MSIKVHGFRTVSWWTQGILATQRPRNRFEESSSERHHCWRSNNQKGTDFCFSDWSQFRGRMYPLHLSILTTTLNITLIPWNSIPLDFQKKMNRNSLQVPVILVVTAYCKGLLFLSHSVRETALGRDLRFSNCFTQRQLFYTTLI